MLTAVAVLLDAGSPLQVGGFLFEACQWGTDVELWPVRHQWAIAALASSNEDDCIDFRFARAILIFLRHPPLAPRASFVEPI